MSDWQPIETAPKDGTRVLIYDPSIQGGVRAAYWESEIDRYDEQGNEFYQYFWTDYSVVSFGYEEVSKFNPTHWMPLPEPPKEERA